MARRLALFPGCVARVTNCEFSSSITRLSFSLIRVNPMTGFPVPRSFLQALCNYILHTSVRLISVAKQLSNDALLALYFQTESLHIRDLFTLFFYISSSSSSPLPSVISSFLPLCSLFSFHSPLLFVVHLIPFLLSLSLSFFFLISSSFSPIFTLFSLSFLCFLSPKFLRNFLTFSLKRILLA